jgi:hypothetical protein
MLTQEPESISSGIRKARGGNTIRKDGSLPFFMDRGTAAIWRDGLLTEVIQKIPAEQTFRFNLFIADPEVGLLRYDLHSGKQGKTL